MNHSFFVKPKSYFFEDPTAFFHGLNLKKEDVILTSRRFAKRYLFNEKIPATICIFGDYCQGEPTDQAIDKIKSAIDLEQATRIIGIGGGSILDASKFLAVENQEKTAEMFASKEGFTRRKELILVPTTCGTGSEVTNIAVCELIAAKTKKGIADDCLYADKAMLVPAFLDSLPQEVYATSAIDALIHGIESYLSPKATIISQDFSELAIGKLISSFQLSLEQDSPFSEVTQRALLGSYYAGIAFTNAGVGTVHAMSYPFGSSYHVAHGESNYVFLFSVLEAYQAKSNTDTFKRLQKMIGKLLDSPPEQAIASLKSLLQTILPLKRMTDYGAAASDPLLFAKSVYQSQQRLLKNAPLPISQELLLEIYNRSM